MRLFEINQVYYHGSNKKLPVGTILNGTKDNFFDRWGLAGFASALEEYKPKNKISQSDSVFMIDAKDQKQIASMAGGTSWMFTLKPIGTVQRHAIGWKNEVALRSEQPDIYGGTDEAKLKQKALNYWNGVPYENGADGEDILLPKERGVWEYVAQKAKIINVEAMK